MRRHRSLGVRGALRRLVAGRIARKLVLTVLVGTLALQAALIAAGYSYLRADLIEDVRVATTQSFRGAVDPDSYPSLDRLLTIGERLTETSEAVGGVYVNSVGEIRGEFGTPPELTWTRARLDGENWLYDVGSQTFELFLGPEVTGLSHGVILAVDVRERWQRMMAILAALAGVAFLTALSMAGLTGIAVHYHVRRPLGAITNAVDFALNEPEVALTRLSEVRRDDEFGQLSRAIDQLLFLTSNLFDDELSAAQAVTEKNPHAILTFSAEGHLVAANAAALRLFSVRDLETLLRRDPECMLRFGGEPMTAKALLAEGAAFGPGEIVLPGATVPCLIGGDTVRGANGSKLGMFLIFVDMTALVADVREEVRLRDKAERETMRLSGALQGLTCRLEACLAVLELGGGGTQAGEPATVEPRAIAESWGSRAVESGRLPQDGLNCERLPALRGDQVELRRMIEASLELVLARAGAEPPRLKVSAVDDGTGLARIAIKALPPEGAEDAATAEIVDEADSALLLAAIGLLARRQDGMVIGDRAEGNGNAVEFAVPVEASAMEAPGPRRAA